MVEAVFTTDYIDTEFKPGKKDLVCEYYIQPNGVSFRKAANHIAAESSIGTWTDIGTMDISIAKKLKPSIFYLNEQKGIIKIAYSEELFEPGNMPQILSSVAGNIFGMKDLLNIRLLDIQFPKKIVSSFQGPRYGISGIRKLSRVTKRPLLGTIIKPKLGLDESKHAKVAYEAWVGGLDIVKDDENLSSMSFNKFNKRIIETLRMRDKAEKETGEKKFYMANVTAETSEMLRRARFVKEHGGEYCMVDIITSGWSALQTLRKNINLVIHAHRAGHGAFTRNKNHGISMLAIAKFARLIGVDQLHIGTASVGKMFESLIDTLAIEEEIENDVVQSHKQILLQRWYGIKPVLAVASGGLHPGSVPKVMAKMGKDIVMQFGGGCHGHPCGTYYGAKAIRQAVDAVMKRKDINEYAKENNHFELKAALVKFGVE
ncbi:MAG: type III ribulose-bisphosphate carboxylase [Candidatus Woesearchaeota archaeon]